MSIRNQSESGRLAVLGAVLVALVAGAFYLGGHFGITSASDSNPPAQMLLEVKPAAPCATPVTSLPIDEVCIALGAEFTLAVDIEIAPDAGYELAQSYILFGSHLIYNEQNVAPEPTATPEKLGEIVWPDCAGVTAVSALWEEGGEQTEDVGEAVAISHGCLTGLVSPPPFDSTYEGNFVEISFNCSSEDSSTELRILESVPIVRSSGAEFRDGSFLITIPKVDELIVNCLPPPPATATPTITPTPTDTPTPTATPTQVPGPIMSLDANTSCGSTPTPPPTPTPTPVFKPSQCTALFFPGQEQVGTFTITVNANVLPDAGYGGFQSELWLDAGLTYTRTACGDEVVWPQASVETCEVFVDDVETSPTFGMTRVRHVATSAASPAFPLSTHVGGLLELDVHCDEETTSQNPAKKIVLTRVPSSLRGAAYFDAADNAIEVGEVNPADDAADVLTITCDLAPPQLSLTAFGSHITSCDTDPTAAPAQTTTPATTDTPTPTPTRVSPLKCTADFIPDDSATSDVDESEGTGFTIAVDANAIPDGYGGFQLELWYGALEALPNSCTQQVVWRHDADGVVCNQLVVATDKVRRISAQTTDLLPLKENKNLGRLVEWQFRCTDEEQVRLVLTAAVGAGNIDINDARPFVEENLQGSAFYSPTNTNIVRWETFPENLQGVTTIDQDGDGIVEDAIATPTEEFVYVVLDLLRINCVQPPAATVTPTITPTLENPPAATATPKCPDPTAVCPTHTATDTPTQTDTPTKTNTPTVTETPTPTLTPAPPDFAQQEVPPGGTVSTGTNAVPSDPIETSVTLPVGGQVSIVEKLIVQPNPAGFTLFGQQVNISAPAGTQQLPLIIQFLIDESIVPDGITAGNLLIFKGGILVPPCTGPSHKASPDPCVAKRNQLTGIAEGDIQITIHTSTASAWNFGQPGGAQPVLGDVDGSGTIDPRDALLVLFHAAGMSDVPFPNVADVNSDGRIDPIDATLILQVAADLVAGFTAATPSGVFWTWLRL